MFEIDLKRGSQRPSGGDWKSDAKEIGLPFLPAVAALTLLAVLLWGLGSQLGSDIEIRRTAVAALEMSVSAKRDELATLAGQRGTMAALSAPEIYWSDVLRLVSEKIPDKLWLSEVKILTTVPPKENPNEPIRRTLLVQGGVLSAASEGNLDVIAKFLETLQADERYREVFAEAKLDSVTRGDEPHTLVFRVTVPFRSA